MGVIREGWIMGIVVNMVEDGKRRDRWFRGERIGIGRGERNGLVWD